jgi:uncharacterized phage protein (TIGR01671 family)
MRDIKFRAWDLIGSKMRGVSFIEYDATGEICNVALQSGARNTKQGYHDPFEERENGEDLHLLQYTGLKDENGREVYEGDIVFDDDQNWEVAYVGESLGVTRAAFMLDTWSAMGFHTFKGMPEDTYEVIGNIYENADLMDNSHV